MKRVFIIRHGETDVNKAKIIQGRGINAPINAQGKKQALAVMEVLEAYSIQKVVASSLIRTHQTAEPLIKKLGINLEKYSDLDEIDFGELEGKEFSTIQNEISHIHTRWSKGEVDFAAAGGESPKQVFERADKKVKQILRNSTEENIAFIIHGRLIRILLSVWLGHGLKNMHLIKHQNGAINFLKWHNDKFEAVKLNSADHLLELSRRTAS